jgi:uncharacterized repeat protein (TIGR03803 family)
MRASLLATLAVALFSPIIAAQTAPPALTTLYSFTGQGTDGALPYTPLVIGQAGTLYGSTSAGGTAGVGTVFALAPPAVAGTRWTETIIHSFTGLNGPPDGAFPSALIGKAGLLYGTTQSGGTNPSPSQQYGTIFELFAPSSAGGAWGEDIIYSFAGGADGAYPYALIFGNDDVLYGATYGGGNPNCTVGCGTVFEWTGGRKVILYTFAGGSDGAAPNTLVADHGALYGAASAGGGNGCGGSGCGTVFKLTPPAQSGAAWTENAIYAFTDGSDGAFPGGLVVGKNGTLYGVSGGINDGAGRVFALEPPAVAGEPWSFDLLYTFTGAGDGDGPWGPVHYGENGALIGVASSGGASGDGTVYTLTPPEKSGGAWTFNVLYSFPGGAAGQQPVGSLAIGEKGAIYGITYAGGVVGSGCSFQDGCGTVFELLP